MPSREDFIRDSLKHSEGECDLKLERKGRRERRKGRHGNHYPHCENALSIVKEANAGDAGGSGVEAGGGVFKGDAT